MSSENTEAFPILSAADLALVEDHGVRRSIQVGDYLFRQGEQTNDFYAVLSGAVEIVVHADGTDRVITRHGPGVSSVSSISSPGSCLCLGAGGRTW